MVAPLGIIAVGVALMLSGPAGAAETLFPLASAGAFGVLAGSGITNTGNTTIYGDIGSFPTPAETGLGSVTLHGADESGDAVTQQAKVDLSNAYTTAANMTPTTHILTQLGGRTLTPGVYNSGTFNITGTLTLDTEGDPTALFVFQTPATLVTASDSSVVVLNGGNACNVIWQVGSSATLGTGSSLIGSVLASASITATTGATIDGRLLAETAAVTLDTNTITTPSCAQAATPTSTSSSPTTVAGGGTTTTTAAAVTTTTAAPVTTTPAGPLVTVTSGPPQSVVASPPGPAGPAGPGATLAPEVPSPAPTPTAVPTSPGVPGTPPSTTPPAVPASPPASTVLSTPPHPVPSSPPSTTPSPVPVPPLPYTGSNLTLPIAGGLTVALGLAMLGLSTLRPRQLRR